MRQWPARAALDRENRFGGEARALSASLPPAAKFLDDGADRPRHHEFRVVRNRFFEVDSRLRQACKVDGEYQWFHIGLGRRSAPQAALGHCHKLSDIEYARTWLPLLSAPNLAGISPRSRRVAPPGHRDSKPRGKTISRAAAIPQYRLEVPRTALEIAVFRRRCSDTFPNRSLIASPRRSPRAQSARCRPTRATVRRPARSLMLQAAHNVRPAPASTSRGGQHARA